MHRRFRLENDQVAWLTFSNRAEAGYTRAEVSVETPRVERAVIAALVALRGRETDRRQGRVGIEAARWIPEALGAVIAGNQPEIPPALYGATGQDVLVGLGLGYAKTLLRHYRPDFDQMAQPDQDALMARIVEKATKYLEALRELAACVQYADPYEGLSKNPVRLADRDVKAAQLRDIEGLTYAEIGRQLGIEQSEHDQVRNDNYRVRTQIVPNGRAILKRVLDEEGYEEFVASSKTEHERRMSLPVEKQFAEMCTEFCGLPPDKIHRAITASDESLFEEIEGLSKDDTKTLLTCRDLWEAISANQDNQEEA